MDTNKHPLVKQAYDLCILVENDKDVYPQAVDLMFAIDRELERILAWNVYKEIQKDG